MPTGSLFKWSCGGFTKIKRCRLSIQKSGDPVKLMTRYTSLLVSLSSDASRVVTIGKTMSGRPMPSCPKGTTSVATELRYLIIDLKSGHRTALEGVPLAKGGPGRFRAAWAPDDKEIALTKVLVATSDGETPPSLCEIALLRLEQTWRDALPAPIIKAHRFSLSNGHWPTRYERSTKNPGSPGTQKKPCIGRAIPGPTRTARC